jgi:hypothetical protein
VTKRLMGRRRRRNAAFFARCVAVDPGAALRGAVVLRQFNDEGDDGLAEGGVFDADEGSMET